MLIRRTKKREISRGDRDIGNAEWQVKQGLYQLEGYNIIVDTCLSSLTECAQKISKAIRY